MIATQISHYIVSKILIDTRSAVNVIFKHATDQIGIPEDRLKPSLKPIFRFNNKRSA